MGLQELCSEEESVQFQAKCHWTVATPAAVPVHAPGLGQLRVPAAGCSLLAVALLLQLLPVAAGAGGGGAAAAAPLALLLLLLVLQCPKDLQQLQ